LTRRERNPRKFELFFGEVDDALAAMDKTGSRDHRDLKMDFDPQSGFKLAAAEKE
jgi:hypothetical protein